MGRVDLYALMINDCRTQYMDVKYPAEYNRLLRLCDYIRVRNAAEAVAAAVIYAAD